MKKRSWMALARAASAVIGLVSGGCDDPLVDPAVVTAPRIVAARVRADADPTLAQPAAGELTRIDWLVLSDEPGSFSAHVAWCAAAPSVIGAPRCGPSLFDEQSLSGAFGEPITLAFSLPGELAPGSAWLAWLGLCEAGEPVFDVATSTFRCGDREALSGFYRGFIPEGVPNHNPSLADDRLLISGAEWPETAPPGASAALPPRAACRDEGLASLRVTEASTLTFELGGDDREPIDSAPGTYAAHARESLVYTHLASHPGLERAFSAIDFDADALRFELPMDFGAEAPGPEGELLRLHLFVRDERGGIDWLSRDACLLPQ